MPLAEDEVTIGRKGGNTIQLTEQNVSRSLTLLRPDDVYMRPELGTITAAVSSQTCDGASAMLIVSEDALKRYNLTPRARILGTVSAGVPPRVMGIGPVPAIRKLEARTGVKLADIDLVGGVGAAGGTDDYVLGM